ncbi:hypothetical protein T484DRAFT_1851357 [Baffinella frigidus]|nr:hypothetical protein T484DRAFT_1851357 [Cryptophyta sp. CCMP2293]
MASARSGCLPHGESPGEDRGLFAASPSLVVKQKRKTSIIVAQLRNRALAGHAATELIRTPPRAEASATSASKPATSDGPSTLAGGAGAGFLDGVGAGAALRRPSGVCLDPVSGDLLVADSGNACVRRVRRDGSVSTLPVSSQRPRNSTAAVEAHVLLGGALRGPRGLAAAPDGLLIADCRTHAIVHISREGVARVVAGCGTKGYALNPKPEALDPTT